MQSLPPADQMPFDLTERDREILSQTDEEFTYHDWNDLKEIICESYI